MDFQRSIGINLIRVKAKNLPLFMYYTKAIFFSTLFFLLVFVTTYFSMQSFADQPAASCLDCSYLKDTFFFSVFSIPLILPTLLIINKSKLNSSVSALVISAIYLAIVFINNLYQFKERVSSWSSYHIQDEIIATLSQSYLFMITGGVIVFLVFSKFYKNKEI